MICTEKIIASAPNSIKVKKQNKFVDILRWGARATGTNIGCSTPGANPTIVVYSASVVNFYNATGSLARFENNNIFILLSKTL
jgi:uncharacterized ion transporter superfamily protein YfcC